MKLKNAAKYFDWDSTYDAYTGMLLFKGQFSGYDSASPDGSFQRRRVVSVAPGTAPAPRRVVTVQNKQWIMGELVTDSFKDKPIRLTAVAKEATDLFALLTPGQAAERAAGSLNLYGHAAFLKDTVNTVTESDFDPQYMVSFGSTETIPDGYFLRSPRQYLHMRSVHLALEGLVVASSDQIVLDSSVVKNCEVDATFLGAMDPITQLPGSPVLVKGILMDMYMLYTYQTQSVEKNLPGDMSLVISNAYTPKAGQNLTISGKAWRVVDYSPYHDAWNIRIRRA